LAGLSAIDMGKFVSMLSGWGKTSWKSSESNFLVAAAASCESQIRGAYMNSVKDCVHLSSQEMYVLFESPASE